MDTEKAWEEFQANDSSIRKSESVQQDIQQILDTVTQIKTEVDQLKAEGPQATGPVDEEPSLSAPEEQQPSPDMTGAPAPPAEPQTPMGDLMAQPEDGAATPVPEGPAPDMGAEVPPLDAAMPPMPEEEIPPLNIRQEDDQDILLTAARRVTDPSIKQQLLAIVYQAIEDQKAPPMPPIEEAAPEEILAAAMDQNGDGTVSEEEIEPMLRSADSETVKCGGVNPAAEITAGGKTDSTPEPVTASADEDEDKEEESDDKKDEEKKDDDDKSERPKKEEPGVNDELPESEEEDKDSLEDLPEVTEVTVETEAEPEPESEKAEAIDSIIDSVLEDAKERIKEQVITATEGIDAEHSPFLMSTAEMMKSRMSGGSHRAFRTEPVRKSIEWPETFEGVSMEDKCRLFARSFSQMPEAMQDNVITLMDTRLGSETTSQIFKSEGVDLDAYYEPVAKALQDNEGATHGETVSGKSTDNLANDNDNGTTESKTESCEESAVQECDSVQDSVPSEQETQPLEACKKSVPQEGVGIHIPTVNEMMAFKKSGTSMYTTISREAAEPHGMVAMGPDNEIPSVKDMFAKRFGN